MTHLYSSHTINASDQCIWSEVRAKGSKPQTCRAFTLCWGQIIREVCRSCPSVPVGVHKLALVFSLAKCIAYTVKGLCRRGIIISIVYDCTGKRTEHNRFKCECRWCRTLPLRPSPMKILYRRELHKTTPTNFLYHVRLTYWLPLQLLWAELYLKVKGIQMGSPPEEQRRRRITQWFGFCATAARITNSRTPSSSKATFQYGKMIFFFHANVVRLLVYLFTASRIIS